MLLHNKPKYSACAQSSKIARFLVKYHCVCNASKSDPDLINNADWIQWRSFLCITFVIYIVAELVYKYNKDKITSL